MAVRRHDSSFLRQPCTALRVHTGVLHLRCALDFLRRACARTFLLGCPAGLDYLHWVLLALPLPPFTMLIHTLSFLHQCKCVLLSCCKAAECIDKLFSPFTRPVRDETTMYIPRFEKPTAVQYMCSTTNPGVSCERRAAGIYLLTLPVPRFLGIHTSVPFLAFFLPCFLPCSRR